MNKILAIIFLCLSVSLLFSGEIGVAPEAALNQPTKKQDTRHLAILAYTLATDEYNAGKYKEAIGHYNLAIECAPNYVDAYINKCKTEIELEKYDDALKDLNKAIGINPQSCEAYMYRGTMYMGNKDYKKAIADYSKAIEFSYNTEKLGEAYFHRAECKYILKDKSGELEDLLQAKDFGYTDGDIDSEITKLQADKK